LLDSTRKYREFKQAQQGSRRGKKRAMTDKLIRKRGVIELTGLSATTIWRRVKDRTFPAPLHISEHVIVWRETDIQAWIAARAAERTDTTARR
jgi:prophage regulatory protein